MHEYTQTDAKGKEGNCKNINQCNVAGNERACKNQHCLSDTSIIRDSGGVKEEVLFQLSVIVLSLGGTTGANIH